MLSFTEWRKALKRREALRGSTLKSRLNMPRFDVAAAEQFYRMTKTLTTPHVMLIIETPFYMYAVNYGFRFIVRCLNSTWVFVYNYWHEWGKQCRQSV